VPCDGSAGHVLADTVLFITFHDAAAAAPPAVSAALINRSRSFIELLLGAVRTRAHVRVPTRSPLSLMSCSHHRRGQPARRESARRRINTLLLDTHDEKCVALQGSGLLRVFIQ